jgi:hypothetical protein
LHRYSHEFNFKTARNDIQNQRKQSHAEVNEPTLPPTKQL